MFLQRNKERLTLSQQFATFAALLLQRNKGPMRRPLYILLLWLVTSGCLSYHSGPMPGEPKDATFKTIADTRVRYRDTGGDKPAVVLLHGFASALETWSGVTTQLEGDHRVISLDLKGFGWTSRPEGDYSPAAQAQLVLGLLDELGVQSFALVAHSWGSSVALQVALDAPQRVERIALYDAWVYEEQIPTAFVWARAGAIGELMFGLFYKERPDDKIEMAFYDKSLLTHEFVEEVRHALDRPGTTAAALAAVRGQRYREVQDRYSSVTQPVLLLWGEDDAVTTIDVGHRLVQQLPNATIHVFDDCGHFPMIEAFAPSTNALKAFLATPASSNPVGYPEAVPAKESM